ncbi:MAG: DUF2079 domain-containing protein [Oscillospiraceae bacterium]|nr:DUF2079 domain-containing protein [Oscillospiraceae bacterium]
MSYKHNSKKKSAVSVQRQKTDTFCISDLLRRVILSWLLACALEYFLLNAELRSMDTLAGLSEMSFPRLIAVTLVLTGVLQFIPARFHPPVAERWTMTAAYTLLAVLVLQTAISKEFTYALIAIEVCFILYAFQGWQSMPLPIQYTGRFDRLYWIPVLLFSAGFMGFIGSWMFCRTQSYGNSTYDFGIFTQMFHNMKTTGLPLTTLERGYLLSHFDVHVSPVYYLLLPLYCLFPQTVTVNLMQAVVLGSACIPLWMLSRKSGLSPLQSCLICLLLFLSPAYIAGTSYDFHENICLAPLLLWLLYGCRQKSTWTCAVFSLLTLMVKEDAAVYVAVIGLWLLVDSLLKGMDEGAWGIAVGAILLGFAVAWFFAVTGYLAAHGDGVMTYRYNNLMFDGTGSLFTVIKAALLSPMKVLAECVEAEKLSYIRYTMGVLLFIPLFTRRYQRYILLIPYILINLISDYSYQHDIFFQYSFGSYVCLIYLTVVNLADLKGSWKRILPIACALVLCFYGTHEQVVPKAQFYIDRYHAQTEYYQNKQTVLDTVPSDASVAATTYLTVPLSQRAEIYDITYATTESVLNADYVVVQCNDRFSLRKYATDTSIGYTELIRLLEENGFTLYGKFENNFVIYRK